ncbi:MAG: rhamnogalacturonan acetylesterase [Verrucomicrobiales bacterium]|nr:rhamnogalacturonan acetylesterase [Verrucomicrobiales bacterium]
MRPHPRTRNRSTVLATALRLASAVALAAWSCGIGFSAEQPALRPTPTLWLIGDSTVKNGRGDGAGGLWGWGQVIDGHFDLSQIRVVNRALGGRSSRTYRTEGLWERVRDELQPGDFVLMQFGHNDGGQLFEGSRPRASLKGNGEETREGVVEQTGRPEVVHTYGWYLRQYLAETQTRGATPIVLSPVPRNIWRDGRIARAAEDYGCWAKEAAAAGHADFIDLNDRVARRYEAEGEERVAGEFFTATDHTHTTKAGAQANATCVVEGIRQLAGCDLREFLDQPSEATPGSDPGASGKFDFGNEEPAPGFLAVAPDSAYSEERGYGWLPATGSTLLAHGTPGGAAQSCLTADGPFLFSVRVPEGNYRVTVTLGDPTADSCTTVKAESRRLMLENIHIAKGERLNRSFTVNVRTPALPGGKQVRLKDRESPYLHWDDKLTLEFNGSHPAIAEVVIEPAPDVTTVYLAGDSTVTDQPNEPWNSWGQMLPRFLQADVAVANHAESGESLRSSLGAGRFEKIFSTLRAGDYLFLQFGHNDMKDRAPDALGTYQRNLTALVRRTRLQGGTPVLITSMERKAGVNHDTLGEYPRVVREVAAAEQAPLIDLHAMSKRLYAALGNRLDDAFQDGTHHNNYGSYLLACCVVEGVRAAVPDLATHLAPDRGPFSPEHPLSPEEFQVPPSPTIDLRKPDGN